MNDIEKIERFRLRVMAMERLVPSASYTMFQDGSIQWDDINTISQPDENSILETMEIIKKEIPLKRLRAERDRKISETDWWVLPDRTPTQEQLDYRQALRDITSKYSSIDDVIWPDKPN
jgi:hypothetical protein